MAEQNKVIFGVQPTLPYALEEALNRLRINISFLGSETKKIMIVSSEPNEGKSFVSMHLWQQMAKAGESAILLDVDMRNSNMVKMYDIKRADGEPMQGMSHFLSGSAEFSEAFFHTDFETADILPNVDNIANPSLLLESSRFEKMLDYSAENYRYVFCDAPPLGLVSDGERIGNYCDGAILCVRGGVTSKSVIKNSMQQLQRSGCPLLGVVLNRVDTSQGGYYNKYYNDKYYSYGY